MAPSGNQILLGLILTITLFSPALADDKKIDINAAERKAEKNACNRVNKEGKQWFDETHTFLSTQFCEPAAWFDSFFSSPRTEEEFRPGSRVRWQNDFVLTEGNGWDYKGNLHFSFKLPKAKKRINIFFREDPEPDFLDVAPALDEGDDSDNDLGLLYEVKESPRANLSLRIKLSPSATIRYRYSYPVSRTFVTRFTQEVFNRDSAYGRTSRLDFEKKLTDNVSFRQSSEGTVGKNIDGTVWQTSFVVLQRLSDISAMSYESSLTGVTDPDNITNNARLGVRYRRSFYRSWLFYELAPAINWPKTLVTDKRVPIAEFLFRLEVNFSNLGSRK